MSRDIEERLKEGWGPSLFFWIIIRVKYESEYSNTYIVFAFKFKSKAHFYKDNAKPPIVTQNLHDPAPAQYTPKEIKDYTILLCLE